MADVRSSQTVVEHALVESADVRVSQFVIEYATGQAVGLRISQFIIEYIPIGGPTPPPPIPPTPGCPAALPNDPPSAGACPTTGISGE